MFCLAFSLPKRALSALHITTSLLCLLLFGSALLTAQAQQTGTVKITLTPPDCALAGHPLTFSFLATSRSDFFTHTVAPDVNGIYTLNAIPKGKYTVAVKEARWLRSLVEGVTVTKGGTTNVNVPLQAGDVNNDNAVDVLDLDLVPLGVNPLRVVLDEDLVSE